MKGFILTCQWRDTPQGVQLSLWLATDSGPLLLQVPHQKAVCFIRQTDRHLLQKLPSQFIGVTSKVVDLSNIYGEPVLAVYCPTQRQLRELEDIFRQQQIDCWEADIKPVERFLMERFITATLVADDNSIRCLPSYQQLTTTRIQASDYSPNLKLLSLDIETSMDMRQLYSIAAYNNNTQTVFMVDDGYREVTKTTTSQDITLVYCPSSRECLVQFLRWLQQLDPDVLIGWHVVQFDLWVLQKLCDYWRVPFTLGRNNQIPHWRDDSQHPERRYCQLPGRVVLDGIELLRTAFYNFDSFSLQAVASELLGDSKLLTDDDRGQAITELYQEDKVALANYNLQDCKLVWRIFEKTRLLDFAIERSRLTGLALDRVGGSVASFDYAYLPRLHRAGYVAPNLGELKSDVVSPGGYVLRSRPGIYRNVLVLDFKSLYPSIIRTFLIDPCAFWVAQHQQLNDDETVLGFNGAYFSRQHAILPDIIAELWQARERAKNNNNQPLSQAIKIIMNSFYGVLGSPGCRFFDPRVCSSITLRGHDIIQQSRDWIQQQGFDVIYGDTDSLFVWLGDKLSNKESRKIGDWLAQALNHWWKKQLQNKFSVDSALEIEFETHYQHFLMPTIRGSSEGSKKRYAGIIDKNGEEELIFKGLETVRSDWTRLAKNFQKTLYYKVFKGESYREFIVETAQQLLAGQLNMDIIYRKKLRRPLEGYQKSNPPHVKAARILQRSNDKYLGRGDRIDYLITVNGPEPVEYNNSTIDYQHYLDKQLKPVANSILVFLDDDFDEIVNRQMMLV